MGTVFDIQYNALYDGAGIRTVVFLKGCPLSCEWCHNPESQLINPQMGYFAEKCVGCGECAKVCKAHAIEVKNNRILRIPEKCEVCGECAKACPNDAVELIGTEMSSKEVAEKVARDKVFYDNSGGGVTISGGEATMQADFLIDTLAAIKNAGIHTAIETCGFFKNDILDKLIELTDLFLFDIKHIDPEIHKKHTGVSNDIILKNFKEILSRAGAKHILPRIPLIPGFNTDPGSIEKIAGFLADTDYDGPVHLMPYNPLAKTKWEKIGRADEYSRLPDLAEEQLDTITDVFTDAGFKIVCNR